MPLARFCPDCGAAIGPIADPPGAGRCMGCARLVFANPRVAAGVCIERAGELLLVERAADPGRGLWDVPGGFIEEGEDAEQAVRRELREELGIELGALALVATAVNPLPGGDVLDILFETGVHSGTPQPGSDVAGFRWFPLAALPSGLAFPSTRRLLDVWLERRREGPLVLTGGERIDLATAELAGHWSPPWPGEGLPPGLVPECGEWGIHDGALCGRVQGEAPAALWLEPAVDGDHALRFRATTAGTARNDINCYWEGSGRILGTGDVAATIGGVAGWWAHRHGIERHPEGGLRATTAGNPLEPGRVYRIVAGRRGASDFLFVDGLLATHVDHPGAPRRSRSRTAIATWNGHLHVLEAELFRLP